MTDLTRPSSPAHSDAPFSPDDALLRTLWQSPFPATLQDDLFRFVSVNDAFVAFSGRARERLIGVDASTLQPEADREANVALREGYPRLDDAHAQIAPQRRRLLDTLGRERWFSLDARRVLDANGQPRWLSVLQDVTAEHEARDAGQRAQDELALWFELCPAGMLVFDDAGVVIRTNTAFESLIGRVLVSLSDADSELQWLLGWEAPRSGRPAHAARGPLERTVTVTLPDGRRSRLLARLRSLPGDDTRHRTMVVVEDRSAEEERDVARREIGVLMDAASIGVATFDPVRGWLPSQAQAPAGLGGGARQGLQGINRELVDAASLPEYERLQHALRKRERAEVRYAVNHPDSGRRWLMTRVEPATMADGRTTLSVVTLDITEQESARQRNEQLLRELTTILDGSTAGIAYLRGDVLVRCNLRFERMLGFQAGEAAGVTLREAFGRRFPADTSAELLKTMGEVLATAGAYECELQAQTPAQAMPSWYSLSVRRAQSEGTSVSDAVAVLTDISRLKAQQAELEDVLRERELMFSLSEVGIAYMRGSRIERANQAMASLAGYSVPELSALDGAELYESTRECVEFEAAVSSALRQSGRYLGERRLRRRGGQLVWVQVAARPVDEADPGAGVITSFVDVDERHRARESLLQQAERTRAILDSVLVGIVTVSAQGIEWMNRSARRMFGGELADFVGEDISTVASGGPEHPLRHSAQHLLRRADAQPETFECRLLARDGRQFWVVGSVVATHHAGAPLGHPAAGSTQLTYALLDIERRRQAEVSIAQAQASLQRVIETAPLAIALFDARSLRVLQLNQMTSSFFARPVVAVQGRLLEECIAPARAAAMREWLEAAALSPEVLHREWRDAGEAASARVWDVRIVALPASDIGAAQLLLVASDVSEQREADQARLQAAITQRELLVREVHHRIKNNLQGVAGLLQQNAHRHPEMATQIGEAVSQVQAIAQVYGLQVGDDGPLRVPRVLETIAASVQRTFGHSILVESADAELSQFVLPEAEAIPIALTLNELLTNAIKHGQGEAVSCGVRAVEGGVMVHIRNQGQLREGFSLDRFPGGVSGLGLVRALLPRRSASLSVEQQGGYVQVQVVLREPSVRRQVP